jgi:hypothetical protein
VRFGLGSLDETAEIPVLLALEHVRHEARSQEPLDLVLAVESCVRRAIETLEGTPLYRIVRPLFGVEPGTIGLQAKQRRKIAAERAGVDPATFVRHDEQRILRTVARRVLFQESGFQAAQSRLGPPPTREEIKASWLVRFQHYKKMEEIARQLWLNLWEVVVAKGKPEDHDAEVDVLDASIWHYARFLAAYEEFLRELGGNWLMPEPDQDAAIANACNLIRWHRPFNERADSYLRTTLADVPELYPFAQRMEDSNHGTELLGRWQAWLEDCHCDLDAPSDSCGPHELMAQCDRFAALVDAGWRRVSERYRWLPSSGDERS